MGVILVATAALPVAYGTSHVALVHRAQLKSGPVLRVLGEAGGVGLSVVQIGKVCGVVVKAVTRGAEKVQFLKSLGVDHVVDPSQSDIIPNVKEFLKSMKLKGVDVLFDPVGGKINKDALKMLNRGANILVIGFASRDVPVIPANVALVKCPQQAGSTECAYYVMKWMYDITLLINDSKRFREGCLRVENENRRYGSSS